jgi:hypothetical protein
MKWKDIPNFAGYQVSDTGLVRTHNKITHTEKHGDRHWKDRVLKFKNAPKAKRNQPRVDLWKDGKPYSFIVARLVAFTFLEVDISNHDLTVNHIDGDWKNNNLSNLELISLADNIRHGFDNGLYTSCNKVKVTNKLTGDVVFCRSQSEGDRIIGRKEGYISAMKKQNKNENEQFKWQQCDF